VCDGSGAPPPNTPVGAGVESDGIEWLSNGGAIWPGVGAGAGGGVGLEVLVSVLTATAFCWTGAGAGATA
jgi:hypothetical protein